MGRNLPKSNVSAVALLTFGPGFLVLWSIYSAHCRTLDSILGPYPLDMVAIPTFSSCNNQNFG